MVVIVGENAGAQKTSIVLRERDAEGNALDTLFLRAQQQGIGQLALTPLTLTMNFRSQANLVSWFNTAFSQIFPAAADIATGAVPYTSACAAKLSLDISAMQFYSANNDQAEAVLLVNAIKNIQTHAPTDSIAILVRSKNHLTAIIPALYSAQLDFQAIDIELLTEKTVVQDLLSLTRALLHRADRIAWLALLRAPFCGLTLSDLNVISQEANQKTLWQSIMTVKSLSEDGQTRITRIKKVLENAYEIQTRHSLATWIHETWLALGGPACLDSPIELTYANAFFNLISKMENENKVFAIEQLTQRLESLYANNKNNAPIQIMTMHKSKGLEFDHVLLPALHKKARHDQSPLFRFIDRPNIFGGNDFIIAPIPESEKSPNAIYDFLKETENKKQRIESARILYVAATRAKKSLHLSAASIDPTSGSFLEKLWPMIDADALPQQPIQKTNQEKILPEKNNLHRLTTSWVTPLPVKSSLHLETHAHIDIKLRSEFSTILGSMIHEVLQTMAEHPNHPRFPMAQWEARLFSLGLLPHDMHEGLMMVKTAVTNILNDPRAQWILSPTHRDARNEWALSSYENNDIYHHVIDRSFIDENNVRWIIDYKTATPHSDESKENFIQRQWAEHKAQLEKYAEIIGKTEDRPIQLALYFPLCGEWISWEYKILDVVA